MSAPLPDALAQRVQLPAHVQEDQQRPAPVPSEALLRGRRLVEIAHNGEVYRLQATRLGKLILTK